MVFAGLGLNPAGVLLFRNHALLSSLGLFRSYAPKSSLRMKWPLPRRPLQAMASLHHLSLGLQNATLGTFAGVGFRRFGLESCWGSAVSQPRTTELLGAVSELCSREFLADEVATSTGAAPGNGIIASSFFRSSERNVRHFCGRWFSQVWAWILLGFCCFATTLYWAPWGCFGAMLQKFLEGLRTQRKGVLRAMVLEGLGLNPGVVLALRNVKQFFGGLSWRLGRAALRRLPLLPWTSFAKECGVGKECGMVKSSLWGRRHGR